VSYLFMLVFVATVVKRDLFNEIVSVISNALDKNMSGLGHRYWLMEEVLYYGMWNMEYCRSCRSVIDEYCSN